MKDKTCATCKKKFKQHSWNQKVCSVECFKPFKSIHDKKYREKAGDVLKGKKKAYYEKGPLKKKCPNCSKEHSKRKNEYCSHKCYLSKMGSMRNGVKNPNWKGGSHANTYNKNYSKWVYDNKGLTLEELGCEMCGANYTVTLDRHHIVFKSEAGWHKEINNPKNIVQCCRSCHLKFHSKSLSRSELIIERKLHVLFPEINLKREINML